MRRLLVTLLIMVSVIVARAQHQTDGVKFAWGAALAGSVDMSKNDMSTIGFDGFFGFRTVGVQALGVGASINIPVNNSYRTIPLYAMLRTNFSSRPTLCFCDLRGGVSINYLENDLTKTGAYLSGGIGFNLGGSHTYQSYLVLGYSYFDRKPYLVDDAEVQCKDLHMAVLRLGISF